MAETAKRITKFQNEVELLENIKYEAERSDVIFKQHEELLKYEAMGQMKVLRYNEQTQDRKQALHEKMVMGFQRANFYQENEAKAVFMKKHFPKAWAEAEVSQQISIRPIQSGEQDLFDDTEYETKYDTEYETHYDTEYETYTEPSESYTVEYYWVYV